MLKTYFIAILLVLTALPFMAEAAMDDQGKSQGSEVKDFYGYHDPLWELKAMRPLLIGGYGDNFNYDGSNVSPLLGKARVILDAERDSGAMVVHLKGTIKPEKGKTYTGDIRIYYSIGKEGPLYREGGVADFVFLHGDTGQEPAVMPRIKTYLGAWGPADVFVNDKLVYKGLDGHMMYTERSRDLRTRAIYNKDKSGFYSHEDPANGSIADPEGRELHFVAHSMKKDKGNFPPQSVWIHINFEKVKDISSYKDGDGRPHMKRGKHMHEQCQLREQHHRGPGHHMGGSHGQGRCGAGCDCGCHEGKECGMEDGRCGAECGCGCNQGHMCHMM